MKGTATATHCPRCGRPTAKKRIKETKVGDRCPKCRDGLPSGKRKVRAT